MALAATQLKFYPALTEDLSRELQSMLALNSCCCIRNALFDALKTVFNAIRLFC
jgi:hypothetical protein